jgi:hypothetical protein
MAMLTKDMMKFLPEGTTQNSGHLNVFCYRGFLMTRRFFIYHSVNRPFDWKGHIDMTFRKCMKPMTDRMMRVV